MIICCGEALVDLVPEPVPDGGPMPVPGGGPMNAAIAAARLGAPAAFVGGISTDAHGEMIWAHLQSNGVNLDASRRIDAPTARAIVEHVPHLVFRFEGEGTADTLLDEADLSTLGEGPHILHGGTLGMFRGRTAATLAELAEAHDGLVSLDPNIRPQIIDDRAAWDVFHDRWLAQADLYKGSDEDLEWIWPERTPEESAAAVLDSGVSAVLITRGAEGLSVVTAAGEVRVAAPSVDVADTVGAGDTICGTVLTSLWEDGTVTGEGLRAVTQARWRQILERAVTAAAITCSRPGADPPVRAEVDW